MFTLILSLAIVIPILKTFTPIFTADTVIIAYGLTPVDVCQESPELWDIIKKCYILFLLSTALILSNIIYIKLSLFKKNKSDKKPSELEFNGINLTIGIDKTTGQTIKIKEKGLYQNFLITGTIGSGKTSSAMYPFTRQLIEYEAENPEKKLAMLILDVKGNYFNQVKKYSNDYNRSKDIIVIELGNSVKYNPLDKPHLKPQVLANRLKTILLLFSENNSESYWLDEAEKVITECIKLCRIYNDGYVNFLELHKLITLPNYYNEKISLLRNLFISNKLTTHQIYDLNTSLEFFEKEFKALDDRTLSILKSEITRITNIFVSDYDILNTFCPSKNDINFYGFEEIIKKGKIVVLNMNIAEYQNLSKIMAAYLKLDFQAEVMKNLASGNIPRTTAFICDEYSEYVTKTDADFFSQSREAKCINIVSTQSYSSIRNTINNEFSTNVIIQNLVNKIWFRTDDIRTIESAQKQLGKEDKEKTSTSISENAKETRYNFLTNSLDSENSNISESINTYTQFDFIYDTHFFTQELETFTAVTFLSDGDKILKPQKLQLLPYFLNL